MKKIISLIILIITTGCSQYSSYDECFLNEMAKMPDGLSDSYDGPQNYFLNSAQRFCREQFPD